MANEIKEASVMTEHTPGPWSVPHFAEADVNCNCQYVLCECYMGSICTVDYDKGDGGDDPPIEEARANARLIAAAPDMLGALQQLLFWNEGIEAGRGNHHPQDHIEIIRAAMAKAVGQNG